jgi:hypothetical protein
MITYKGSGKNENVSIKFETNSIMNGAGISAPSVFSKVWG